MYSKPVKYRLRWRYDYASSPSKWGMWSNAGGKETDKAWVHNKPGVSRACIEGENVETGKIVPLAECDGHDFINFQWLAGAFIGNTFAAEIKPLHRLLGMKLLTREKDIQVLDTGEVTIRARTEGEKQTNFATFGK